MAYIPEGDQERKDAPMFRGLLGYFPAALFEVAAHSLDSDRKHNPGNPTAPNWAKGKSSDHEDCLVRHLIDAGPRRGLLGVLPAWLLEKLPGSSARDARRYHLRCLAWRALALLQEDCEATDAKPGVSCVFPAAPPAPAPLMHPAQKLAADADLVDRVWRVYANAEGEKSGRVKATLLVRDALGVGLGEAGAWLKERAPGIFE